MQVTSLYINREGHHRMSLLSELTKREVNFTIPSAVYTELLRVAHWHLVHREDGMELWHPGLKSS